MFSPLPTTSYPHESYMDSAERLSAGLHRSSTGAGHRSGAKVRPGSFKAKLQKICRDCDAAETRMVSVPVDKASRAVDLQDSVTALPDMWKSMFWR
jgi:hypothetical protein